MNVHLFDGTYELFRHFFAIPSGLDVHGNEVAAVRGVLSSIMGLLEGGATHVGVATDHVIESFRNDLYMGYKTGDGIEPLLLSQFPILEEALECMGVKVWPMVEFEADDALAAAAAKAALHSDVAQVLICTPDKDLAQCVVDNRVVQFDRMRGILRDEAGVIEKWGVKPESIPDYLAVVGDSADGFPGLPGWGSKGASLTFGRYPHLEDIPKDWRDWNPAIRGAKRLASVLFEQWAEALLYRTLATLRTDVPVFETLEDLRWKGPTPQFEAYCSTLQLPALYTRANALTPY
jgi:5'-3' exonuclease